MAWLRRRKDRPAPVPPAAVDSSDDVRFFFYFDAEEPARTAGAVLESKGYGVTVTPPRPEIPQWSVIAEGVPDTRDTLEADEALRPWAASLGGEYDGSEQRVG